VPGDDHGQERGRQQPDPEEADGERALALLRLGEVGEVAEHPDREQPRDRH
jgi:hypothetical protein